jgi:hypothetical protein
VSGARAEDEFVAVAPAAGFQLRKEFV